MRKEIKNKIMKVTDSIYEALSMENTGTKFDIEEVKKFIKGKYKLSLGFVANSYKIEIKGFTINIYAQKKDTYAYVEVMIMINKNTRINEHFALFFTVDQLEMFLDKMTK